MDRTERQKLGLQKWINVGCRGTLAWSTGVGKTFAAIMAIRGYLTKNKSTKILVIVPTEHLKVQWLQALTKAGLYFDVKIEIINSAIKNNEKIDFIILDEVHRYAADLFHEIFKAKNPSLVLGLSATFNRLDGKEILLSKYCPVCDVITVKEATENNWLSQYKEYKVLLEVDDIHIYYEYNREFNEAFAFFDYDFNLAMKCVTDIIYRRRYAKTMGVGAKELDGITFSWLRSLKARKQFVMDHPKKIEITKKILSSRPNSKAITFSATIKQAEKIGNGFVVHSGKTKKKNRLTIEEFSKLDKGVIHTAKSLDEGVDIKGLNLAIILCNTSSKTQKTQRVGRVIRYEEGKESEIFTLVIKNTNEESWYNTSTAGKSYIEITEAELYELLDGKITNNPEITAEESPLLFRL